MRSKELANIASDLGRGIPYYVLYCIVYQCWVLDEFEMQQPVCLVEIAESKAGTVTIDNDYLKMMV